MKKSNSLSRVLSLVFAVVLVFALVPTAAMAYTGHSREEASAWVYSRHGLSINYDGAFGA